MTAPAAALPARQAAVLAYLVDNQVGHHLVQVEAGNSGGPGIVPFPRLKALADKGLVDITWRRQSALYGTSKPYRVAKITEAGRAAHAAAQAPDVPVVTDPPAAPAADAPVTFGEAICREQAEAIARLADALAAGTLVGPRFAAVARLTDMVATLAAWTPDDRS